MASQDSAVEVTEEEEVVLEGSTRAAWEGSDVTRPELEWLIRTKRIPAGVECRLPVLRFSRISRKVSASFSWPTSSADSGCQPAIS